MKRRIMGMEKEVIKERMFDGIKYICTNGRKEKSKCLSIFVINL